MASGVGPVSPNPGKSRRTTRRLSRSACAQPSQACSEEPKPCSSTIGLASSRGPSSRTCTGIPSMSKKTEGGAPQRGFSSARLRSGTQFIAIKTAPATTAARSTKPVMSSRILIVFPFRSLAGMLSDVAD